MPASNSRHAGFLEGCSPSARFRHVNPSLRCPLHLTYVPQWGHVQHGMPHLLEDLGSLALGRPLDFPGRLGRRDVLTLAAAEQKAAVGAQIKVCRLCMCSTDAAPRCRSSMLSFTAICKRCCNDTHAIHAHPAWPGVAAQSRVSKMPCSRFAALRRWRPQRPPPASTCRSQRWSAPWCSTWCADSQTDGPTNGITCISSCALIKKRQISDRALTQLLIH